MPIIATGTCNVGRARKINQDNIYLNPEKNLFLVADGMGGHEAGEIASRMALDNFVEFFDNNPDMEIKELINKSLMHANQAIKEFSQQENKMSGMGTTFVGLIFRGTDLYICNVGDSRSYLINQNKLFQLSRDHSLIQEKINFNIYTREEARLDKSKNILTQAVGFDENVKIDIFHYRVQRNDMFILCSDGLHGMVPDSLLLSIIEKDIPNPEAAQLIHVENAVRNLVQTALVNGGVDNISCILVLAQ